MLVGIAEVVAITRGQVSVLGAHFAVTCGQPPVRAGFLAITPRISQVVAFLGAPVTLFSASIPLIGAFDEGLDSDIALDRIHLVQDRVLGPLTSVSGLLAPVGSAITAIDPPVTAVDPPVTAVDPPVTPVGVPIAPVRCQVPTPASIAFVGGVVTLTGRPVTRLTGKLSLRRRAAVLVRSQVASLR